MATETVAGSVGVGTAVTVLTLNLCVCAFKRKARHIVIECRRSPSRHLVACTAVLRKIRSFVIGVGCVEIVGAVAGITISRRSGKLGRMTTGAVKTLMPAFENWRRWMIESCPFPGHCRRTMALHTIAVESS